MHIKPESSRTPILAHARIAVTVTAAFISDPISQAIAMVAADTAETPLTKAGRQPDAAWKDDPTDILCKATLDHLRHRPRPVA